MNPREYWCHFVERHGGLQAVSTRLGIPYGTIANITNGNRGIGRNLAQRMADADPLLDARVLVFVAAIKKPVAAADASSDSTAVA